MGRTLAGDMLDRFVTQRRQIHTCEQRLSTTHQDRPDRQVQLVDQTRLQVLPDRRHAAAQSDVTASRRYWTEDVIDPEVEVTPQGTIRVPPGPGTGYAPRLDRIEKLTARKEILQQE